MNSVTLTPDCTPEMLYHYLKELGADVKKIRKKNPSFAELEQIYYMLLDARLSGGSKRVGKSRY